MAFGVRSGWLSSRAASGGRSGTSVVPLFLALLLVLAQPVDLLNTFRPSWRAWTAVIAASTTTTRRSNRIVTTRDLDLGPELPESQSQAKTKAGFICRRVEPKDGAVHRSRVHSV